MFVYIFVVAEGYWEAFESLKDNEANKYFIFLRKR